MGIETILAILGFAITAAGLIGVSFRVGKNGQTVSNYREAASAWETKARAQAEEITTLQEQLADAKHRLGELEARLQLLQDMVTGRAAVADLAAQVQKQFADLAMQTQRHFSEHQGQSERLIADLETRLQVVADRIIDTVKDSR